MCAQNVWGVLWQQKKGLLEEIFKREVDLDLYSARATCGEMANKYWLQFVEAQTEHGGNDQVLVNARVGQFPLQIQSKLTRVAKTSIKRLTSRKSVLTSVSSLTVPFRLERMKIDSEVWRIFRKFI
jgi:hypothetical protein